MTSLLHRAGWTGAALCVISGAGPYAWARGPREGTLPQSAVVSNLRSLSGRTLFLLLRQGEGAGREQVEEMARRTGATLAARQAGDLLVVMLTHPQKVLHVHRRGHALEIESAPAQPLASPKELAAPPLLAGRPDGDVDLEIMLRARQAMRGEDQVPPAQVAQAQGAAARVLLQRYASGDELAAALWGARHQALIVAHPDAKLLNQVALSAIQVLEVLPPPPQVAPPAPPAPPLKSVEDALTQSALRIPMAQAFLKEGS